MGILKRNIGLNFNADGQSASVRLWAPLAKSVVLKIEAALLESNGPGYIELHKEPHGYWSVKTDLIRPGDKYWFVLDGNQQLADPASLSQPDGVHGASEAISLNLAWTDGQWRNIPLRDYILYELHTGTFSAGGDFEGIAEHLDHLLDLGITAIEIMPVSSFPGTWNWGYDGVFPFAVQSSYGGALGLQELVSLCHQKGLAVVLDVVYNHLGPEGNYLGQFGPYFTDKYKTPWGNALNFDDAECDGVREYFIENALMWFKDFHIDALRLDAVHAIRDFGAVHILQEICERTDQLMRESGRVHYLIVESDLNDPRFISALGENGMGMDAQWTDEFHHALRVAAGGEKTGYYADFNGIAHLAKSYKDAYVYTRMYSEERKKTFGRDAGAHSGERFIVFSQNHDQVGNRMLGERTSTLVSFEMQKLLAAAVLCAPFLPMLFMGEEWGETNPFLYFIDHTDSELVDLVRKGRKAEFAVMHAEGVAPDPKSEQTFEASKLNWDRLPGTDIRYKNLQNGEGGIAVNRHERLFVFYKHMIALRKNNLQLGSCDRSAVRVYPFEDKNCLILERGLSGSKELVLCLMNFSGSSQTLTIPSELTNCIKIADSADPAWLGPMAAPEAVSPAQNVHIFPESFIAYSAMYV